MTRLKIPMTVPTFVHQYYQAVWEQQKGLRFRDLPAFRGFVGYQVRLVTSLIARSKGYKIDDPLTIATLNANLREQDLDDLGTILYNLGLNNLISPHELEGAMNELNDLQEQYLQGKVKGSL
jgi:hypothetical protein